MDVRYDWSTSEEVSESQNGTGTSPEETLSDKR